MGRSTIAEHPNAVLIRKMYEAFAARGYADAVSELFSNDVVWHPPGSGPLNGDHEGREAVLAAMRWFEERSDGSIRLEVHDVVGGDDHAVALLRATGARQGRRYDSREVDIFHMRDGRVTEFWSFAEDQRLTDEFWRK